MLCKIVIGLVTFMVGASATTLTPEAAKKYLETGVYPHEQLEGFRKLADDAEHHMRIGAARRLSWWKDSKELTTTTTAATRPTASSRWSNRIRVR